VADRWSCLLPSQRSVQRSDDPQHHGRESILLDVIRDLCYLGVRGSTVLGTDMPISPDLFDHEFPPLEGELGEDLIAPPKEPSASEDDTGVFGDASAQTMERNHVRPETTRGSIFGGDSVDNPQSTID